MKPLPFFETFAHPNDLLCNHLERVGQLTADNVASLSIEVRMTAVLSGLFHDIGKATRYFQEYLLHGGKKSSFTSHAPIGSILACHLVDYIDLPMGIQDRVKLGVFLSILRHHGRLRYSWTDELLRIRHEASLPESVCKQQMKSIDLTGITTWLYKIAPVFKLPLKSALLKIEASDPIEAFVGSNFNPLRLQKAYSEVVHAIGFMASFGSVLSVDKIDAALTGDHIPRHSLPENCVAKFKQDCIVSSNSELDRRRQEIADTVVSTLIQHREQYLFTLTAPTGSGKTLTIAKAAIALRSQIKRETGEQVRIIYCLPFTTIIDQNYEVFARVLEHSGVSITQDILLKHHHLTEAFYRTSDDTEYEPDGAGELLTETWQSEMIVTTFYQLLHSMLSPLNREVKRAGQLVNSIVLMDEVQAVPLRYWGTLRNLFRAMAKTLNTRFVLLTATRPLIFQPGDAVELLPDHDKHFKAMSRTELFCHHGNLTPMNAFTDALSSEIQTHDKPILVVLNRRKTVQWLYRTLREAFPSLLFFALSTDLTPKDRRDRIKKISESLNNGERPVVVSTQLIEAGVDMSFPIVHRDLAPLDSIIQSAGRCNRTGVGPEGSVHLWNLADDGGNPQWRKVYDKTLIDATCDVLGSRTDYKESDYLDLSRRYFHACWNRADQEAVEDLLAKGDFEKLKEFKLIEDGPPTHSFFVVQNDEDDQFWKKYKEIRQMDRPRDAEKLFKSFKREFFDRVVQVSGRSDPNEPVQMLLAGKDTYDSEIGFISAPTNPCVTIL